MIFFIILDFTYYNFLGVKLQTQRYNYLLGCIHVVKFFPNVFHSMLISESVCLFTLEGKFFKHFLIYR